MVTSKHMPITLYKVIISKGGRVFKWFVGFLAPKQEAGNPTSLEF